MELKTVFKERDELVFRFQEDGGEFAIRLPDELRGFGYLAFAPLQIEPDTPENIDAKLKDGDVVLTFVGQERTLLAAAQVIASLLEQNAIPLRMVVEERHVQHLLTFITNTLFFDKGALGREVNAILVYVHAQIPEAVPVIESEKLADLDDPLDRIGLDDTLSIYTEGEGEDVEQDLVAASEVTDT